ncbi:MAG: methyltransferase domain-containing protein [Propionibacteriaceae bacterium]|jgi:SAM-dependent methyltransferase|nr:methyltransferase domain-containing protein [Propionibacteriaceae bacterium]
MAPVIAIPPEALEWLTGTTPVPLLLVGASGGYATTLARAGHSVTVVDHRVAALARLPQWGSDIHVVAARGEYLPFDPRYFAVVLAIQDFHTFTPGLALGEWARVLRRDGRIAIAYVTRDDSIPWVRKLKRIVQTYLPEAMSADFGARSVASLQGSAFFPHVERTSYRLWVPSTRAELQASACHAAGADDLEEPRLTAMAEEIGALYDEYARVPDPLLLPYQIECWRAGVDQSSLTTSLITADDGLSISL